MVYARNTTDDVKDALHALDVAVSDLAAEKTEIENDVIIRGNDVRRLIRSATSSYERLVHGSGPDPPLENAVAMFNTALRKLVAIVDSEISALPQGMAVTVMGQQYEIKSTWNSLKSYMVIPDIEAM